MPDTPVRDLAVQRLLRVEADGAHVARLGDGEASAEAARAASDFVAGVTRQKRYLDYLLDTFYRGDLRGIEPVLLQVLRLGAYDLVVRETKPHAAVNEAVASAKRLLRPGAGGLANGVLRALSRAQRDSTLPEPASGDLADDLAVRHSHPTWMVRRWLARFGPEATESLLVHNNTPARYALRLNGGPEAVGPLLDRLREADAGPEPSVWLDDFLTVGRLQPVLRGGFLREGTCAVQDEAAGLVVRVLDPQPGEAVLDGAAAPGGKAIYAALRMQNEGRVVAVDVSEAKRALVARSARAQGAAIVEAVKADLTAWDSEERFARVLLDAPCSGTGVLAKRADLRWNRAPEDLAQLADLQDRLLDAAAARVAPGGLLVYSTCSIEPEENDARVDAFLARHASFAVDPVGDRVSASMADGPVYRALPHVHGTDGAFAARLRHRN